MSFDIPDFCRTCLSMDATLASLDNINMFPNDINEGLVNMLSDFTNTTKYDWIAAQICSDCYFELKRCYSFKLKCINSNSTFAQLFGKCIEQQELSPQHNIDKEHISHKNNENTSEPNSQQLEINLKKNSLKEVKQLTSCNTTIQVEKEGFSYSISWMDEDIKIPNPNTLVQEKQKSTGSDKSVANSRGDKKIKKIPNVLNEEQLDIKPHIDRQNAVKPRKCPLCGKSTNDLNKHLKVHERKIWLKCKECTQAFVTKIGLRMHIRNCHLGNPFLFVCKPCGQAFFNSTEFYEHKQNHWLNNCSSTSNRFHNGNTNHWDESGIPIEILLPQKNLTPMK